MSASTPDQPKRGFCVFVDTLCEGPLPGVWGENAPVVYDTEEQAQREIAEHKIIRLQQFLDGEREFEDAMTIEEYIVPVCVDPNDEIRTVHSQALVPSVTVPDPPDADS
jgi:hypothetical protein